MFTYTARPVTEKDKCDMCGESASVVYVSDSQDETGYVDEIACCEEHDVMNKQEMREE